MDTALAVPPVFLGHYTLAFWPRANSTGVTRTPTDSQTSLAKAGSWFVNSHNLT
jgi:hypothetical protein